MKRQSTSCGRPVPLRSHKIVAEQGSSSGEYSSSRKPEQLRGAAEPVSRKERTGRRRFTGDDRTRTCIVKEKKGVFAGIGVSGESWGSRGGG